MRRLSLALLFSLWCSASMAAVTLDANSTAPYGSGASSVSSVSFTNLTVGTGHSNYALIVSYSGCTATVSSMTWGAQSLALIASQHPGCDMELWGLVNPTSGNQTLTVTMSGSGNFVSVNAESFYNVNQTGGVTTFYNSGTNSGSGTTATITVSNAIGDMVVDLVNSNTTATTPLGTQLFVDATQGSGGSYIAGASSVTLGWTFGTTQTWEETATAIKAAAAAVLNRPIRSSPQLSPLMDGLE